MMTFLSIKLTNYILKMGIIEKDSILSINMDFNVFWKFPLAQFAVFL